MPLFVVCAFRPKTCENGQFRNIFRETNPAAHKCVGCAIVKGDHAPDCGVAQGVIHGVVGHHGKKEEEVEEELGQEVKGQKEENAQTPVRMTMTMDEMERHCEALEPM